MNKIVNKQQLSEMVYRMSLEAPLIASERKPGQFIILQLDSEYAERIPLTIAGADTEKGTIDIIYQVAGATTRKLSMKNRGDFVENVLGPLGQPTHIQKFDKPVICVGGGIGAAPLLPIAKGLKEAGNKVISIIGARNKDLMILQDDFKAISDEVILCSDDGSIGRKAVVTVPLEEFCSQPDAVGLVVMIGPPIMMKFCAGVTKKYNVNAIASLNPIMVDGTGMCGGCRVKVGGKLKFGCVDGPEFDANQIDFDNLISRLGAYKKQEEEHKCRLDSVK